MTNIIFGQTRIVNVNSIESINTAPSGTYIKDINNTFTKYVGTWKYENGNQIFIIKIEKVTQYYYPQYGTYQDFLKGNYSYSIDGGATFVVNTITANVGNNDRNTNTMYSPNQWNNMNISFRFKDVLHNKSCDADFKFVNNSIDQMQIRLKSARRGYIFPAVMPPAGFSVPNNIVLIRQ